MIFEPEKKYGKYMLSELVSTLSDPEFKINPLGYLQGLTILKNKIYIISNAIDYVATKPGKITLERLNEFIWFKSVSARYSDELVVCLVDRISQMENPTVESVIEDELTQQPFYDRKKADAFEKVERDFGMMSAIGDQYKQFDLDFQVRHYPRRYSSKIKISIMDYFDKLKQYVKLDLNQKHVRFITENHIENAAQCLEQFVFQKSVHITATIGYDYGYGEQSRLKCLVVLKENNGRTKQQRKADGVKQAIDSDVIDSLRSIVEHDPCDEVVEFADKLVKLYEINGSFKV